MEWTGKKRAACPIAVSMLLLVLSLNSLFCFMTCSELLGCYLYHLSTFNTLLLNRHQKDIRRIKTVCFASQNFFSGCEIYFGLTTSIIFEFQGPRTPRDKPTTLSWWPYSRNSREASRDLSRLMLLCWSNFPSFHFFACASFTAPELSNNGGPSCSDEHATHSHDDQGLNIWNSASFQGIVKQFKSVTKASQGRLLLTLK